MELQNMSIQDQNEPIENEESSQLNEEAQIPNQTQKLRSTKEANGTFMIMQILFKLNVGAGILGLPYTIYQTGYEIGIPVFIALSMLVFYANLMLVKLTEFYRNGVNWQSEMIEEDFGDKTKNIFVIFICISTYGAPVSYLLFFFKFFDYVVFNNTNSNQIAFTHQTIYITIALQIIIPIILFNKFRFYAKISVFGNVCKIRSHYLQKVIQIVCLTIVIVLSYQYSIPYEEDFKRDPSESIGLLIGLAGTYADIKICDGQTQPILNAIIQNYFNSFISSQVVTVFTVGVIYLIFSILCSYNFNVHIDKIVLFSLPKNLFASFVQIFYSLALVLTFPVILLTAFQQLETIQVISECLKPRSSDFYLKRSLLRLIQVFFITFIAIFIPDFTSFLSLIGSLSFIIQAYLFPMIQYYKRVLHKISKFQKIIYLTLQSIGFLVSGYSFFISLIKLVKGFI